MITWLDQNILNAPTIVCTMDYWSGVSEDLSLAKPCIIEKFTIYTKLMGDIRIYKGYTRYDQGKILREHQS